MSYCRWSSDNGNCDLYCYKADTGYVIHVASRKPIGDPPEIVFDRTPEEMIESAKVRCEFYKTAEYRDLGLPYDGVTFGFDDLESFLERLFDLREVGYNFPDTVIEDIVSEIVERSLK